MSAVQEDDHLTDMPGLYLNNVDLSKGCCSLIGNSIHQVTADHSTSLLLQLSRRHLSLSASGSIVMLKVMIAVMMAAGLTCQPVEAAEAAVSTGHDTFVNQIDRSLQLHKQDFLVTINQLPVALMEPWNAQLAVRLGTMYSSHYVGASPENSEYKFYRHRYEDFTLYTSNLDWDKQQRSIDSYRIAQITLLSPELMTARGIHIGSSEQALLQAYGAGVHERYNDVQRRTYHYHGMELVFTLQQRDVSGIALVWSGRH
ncbi:hypothetical protein [Izhakiella capsodis]|nr:hypothetical protein [Izhakiella capsodis]